MTPATPTRARFAPRLSPDQELRRTVDTYGAQPVTHAVLESLSAHLSAYPRPRLDRASARRRLVGLWVGRGLVAIRDGCLVLTPHGQRALWSHQAKVARAHGPGRPEG